MFVFCFGEDTGNDLLGGGSSRFKVGVQVAFGGFNLRVAEHILDGVQIRAGLDEHGRCGVPLRYNKDKRKNPVFSRVSAFVVAYSIPFPTLIVNEKSVE